jgi:hypothetical protein
MSDIAVIIAGPSTSHVLMKSEIRDIINEVLDNDIRRQCSSCDSDDNYTHLVTPGTHN